jgi:hypothetical protein
MTSTNDWQQHDHEAFCDCEGFLVSWNEKSFRTMPLAASITVRGMQR